MIRRYLQPLMLLALCGGGSALPAEGVTITNQSAEAFSIVRLPQGGAAPI
jgi:hypothetical protein